MDPNEGEARTRKQMQEKTHKVMKAYLDASIEMGIWRLGQLQPIARANGQRQAQTSI
jgi:hypothetical protein